MYTAESSEPYDRKPGQIAPKRSWDSRVESLGIQGLDFNLPGNAWCLYLMDTKDVWAGMATKAR